MTKVRIAQLLVVEDNEGDVELLRGALKRAFVGKMASVLHVVVDGEEALEFLEQRGRHTGAPRPDLILLDLNIPKISGTGVLKKIKQTPVLRRIPVVVLTSSEAKADVHASFDLHAQSYMVKPVTLKGLRTLMVAFADWWFVLGKVPIS